MFRLVTPQSEQELKLYFHFRWQMLREPWLLSAQSAMLMTI